MILHNNPHFLSQKLRVRATLTHLLSLADGIAFIYLQLSSFSKILTKNPPNCPRSPNQNVDTVDTNVDTVDTHHQTDPPTTVDQTIKRSENNWHRQISFHQNQNQKREREREKQCQNVLVQHVEKYIRSTKVLTGRASEHSMATLSAARRPLHANRLLLFF